MAKDVLSIAMAGVGVERIFNSGRDTCQYRRGHLHAETRVATGRVRVEIFDPNPWAGSDFSTLTRRP